MFVKHKFPFGLANTKQAVRIKLGMTRSPAVYKKQAQSCWATCLFTSAEHHLIRANIKHNQEQREVWQASAERQTSRLQLLQTEYNPLQFSCKKASLNQTLRDSSGVFSFSDWSVLQFSLSPSHMFNQDSSSREYDGKISILRFSDRVGHDSHTPSSSLLYNSPLPWQWLLPGRVWSNKDQFSRLLRHRNHRTPRLMMHASGKKSK